MRVDWIALLNSRVNAEIIVISNMLLSGSTDSIMMLVDAHLLKHLLSCIEYLGKISSRSRLIDCLLREDLEAGMEVSTTVSYLLLAVCSACKVASPVAVSGVSVGEHIIILYWPDNVLLFQSIQIDTWS